MLSMVPLLPSLLLVIASIWAIPAWADPPSVRYRLTGEDAFMEGCFGECMCPVRLGQLEGTFTLTPAGPSGDFETWTVTDVDWQVPQTGSHLTGSGFYQRSFGDDAQQQLILDLSIDGGAVEQYDSGVVPAEAPFPRIDALVSLFDMTCWDRVLLIEASPAVEPVAFRFEAVVTSVFDGLGALGDRVAVGDRLRSFYVFDPGTPNTAPPVGEGEAGLYHHDRPPAGVRVRVNGLGFGSVWRRPDFDIIVNDDISPDGADQYGFVSRNNRAQGLLPTAPIGRLVLDWLASTTTAEPLGSADLPLTPPDLDLLGGGLLAIEGECVQCMGPAAFFRIEATLTSLRRPVYIWFDREHLWWEGPGTAWQFDVVHGDLETLRLEGDFSATTQHCLAERTESTALTHDMTPDPGEGIWFLVRPSNAAELGTYDSCGLLQEGTRDGGVDASGHGCP